jgi:hypothetical protein
MQCFPGLGQICRWSFAFRHGVLPTVEAVAQAVPRESEGRTGSVSLGSAGRWIVALAHSLCPLPEPHDE